MQRILLAVVVAQIAAAASVRGFGGVATLGVLISAGALVTCARALYVTETAGDRIGSWRGVTIRPTFDPRVGPASYMVGTGCVVVGPQWFGMTHNQRRAVLAHEMCHARDTVGNTLTVATGHGTWGLLLLAFVANGVGEIGDGHMASLTVLAASSFIMRRRALRVGEFEADLFAHRFGLGRELAGVLRETGYDAGPFATHPPVRERLARLI